MILSDTVTLNGILQDMYFEGKFNASTFDPNDVLRIVNKYYCQLQEGIRSINEDFYLLVSTTDLVIGDGSYTFPDGTSGTAPAYERIKMIYGAFTPADITAPLVTEYTRCNLIAASQVTNPAYEFAEPTAIIFGNYFVLHPLVTDVTKYPVTKGVKMAYIPQLDRLVNPTDVPNIFPAYHDIITWGSLIEIAQRLGNVALEAKAQKRFETRMEEMKAYASNRVESMLGNVVEGQNNGGGWDFPYGQQSMS